MMSIGSLTPGRIKQSLVYRTKRFSATLLRPIFSRLESPQGALRYAEPFFRLLGMRSDATEIDLARMQSALVVRLDEIGDVVLTTPLLRELRRNLPHAWITLVVKPGTLNLVEHCPYVDETLVFDCNVDWQDPQPREQMLHRRAINLARRHLWRRRFDLALLPRSDIDHYHASFLAYFSGARWRVGYANNELGPKAYEELKHLFTHIVEVSRTDHEVQRNLKVLTFLKGEVESDALELWVDGHDQAFSEQVLRSHDTTPDQFLIAICPGAREAKKIWPLENFVKIAKWMRQEYNAQIMLVGGPTEAELGVEFQKQCGFKIIDMIGKTTLRQTVSLLRYCDLFIGNDTGPMHLAAAVETPVIEICCHPSNGSPTHHGSPNRFGPWGVPKLIFQPGAPLSPCVDACTMGQAHCILGVEVERVKMTISQQCESLIKRKSTLAANHVPPRRIQETGRIQESGL